MSRSFAQPSLPLSAWHSDLGEREARAMTSLRMALWLKVPVQQTFLYLLLFLHF